MEVATDPVAEAERALEEALDSYACALLERRNADFPLRAAAAEGKEVMALARRYAAERAVAALDECLILRGCGVASLHLGSSQLARCVHSGGERLCRTARREALEKEVADGLHQGTD